MDKIEQLYNLYLQKGLISSAVTLDIFRAANDQQQASLYDLGKKNNLFSSASVDDFRGAWGQQQPVEAPQPQEQLKKKRVRYYGITFGRFFFGFAKSEAY